LAPVEAAFSKCAIIANDIPVFRELWGSAACYFQTNNGEDLARMARVLTSDPDLCRQYGESACQRASRMFTAERMVEEYRLLYRNVAATQAVA
jgi:glycosyltransferase involved in cell wall biosynthesis